MPRPPNQDPLRATVAALGEQIGRELADAITRSFTAALDGKDGAGRALALAPPAVRRGRPATGGTPCRVSGCARRSVSKGLCSNHYQKAHRLKLDTANLSDGNLATLAQDGRALRFKNGASALVAKRRKTRK